MASPANSGILSELMMEDDMELIPSGDLSLQYPRHKKLEQCRMELDYNLETWKDAYLELERYLTDHIDKYQAFCSMLQETQSEIISEAYSMPTAERVLGEPDEYTIPTGDRFVFIKPHITISCMPKLKDDSESTQNSPTPAKCSLYVDCSTQTHDEFITWERESAGIQSNQVAVRPQKSHLNDRQRDENEEDSKRVRSTQPPLATASQKKSKAKLSSQLSNSSEKLVRGYLVSQATEEAWSLDLKLASRGPIKRDRIWKSNFWVFPYDLEKRIALYVLKCPKESCGKVFSKHPLESRRAARHLRNCGFKFEDQYDMVRRYAFQVVKGRERNLVTVNWALCNNAKLCTEPKRKEYRKKKQLE
nr:uncharacterized protein CTRU02_05139 [Colletotrichum truncatum]KAF6794307.1 hypothetical protein CTRU02_05139 [Colletotrichum truncatum]